jgi:mono/diheme cytochrome c family protein
MTRLHLAVVAALLCLPTLRAADAPAKKELPAATKRPIDFARDVRPILQKTCVGCHGPDKQRGGLRLDDGALALKGGNSGPAFKPGDAAGSRLLTLAAGLDPERHMPPGDRKPLTPEEIGHLRAWIEQGADWPKGDAAVKADLSTHWAFQPIKRPAVPDVKDTSWPRNDLDRFVLARLEKERLAPSPEADRVTLIRRLSLDLIGLPPSPEEVEAFVGDRSADAYEKVVDRLLASPHYGERWGRHWLDAARYADSDGFEKDGARPYAWRYRNWVLDALNRDLPYDRFIVEQLAGDLLPDATAEQKVATGFHRNTLTNKEGGVDAEQFRVEQVLDRVNTTARVFLGATLGCAQCHDHKYDPFSQRDYYQFFAFFNGDDEVDIPAPVSGEEEALRKAREAHEKKFQELTEAVSDYRQRRLPEQLRKWEDGLTLPELRGLPAGVRAVLLVEPALRSAPQALLLVDYFAQIDPQLKALNRAVEEHRKSAPKPTLAPTIARGKGRKTHVLIRGDFLRPGVEVGPGVPAVLGGTLPEKATRLDLARWIASADNPLTARVAANWVWHRYFGRGLVATLEDFGTQGEKPSHPELLDHLATELVRRKWSLKAFHRYLVTSATYRQSSKARPELAERDPNNVLLARQSRQRLEAEILRDQALAVSGLLTRTVGGPSVRPPQPAGISELTYAGSAKWVESVGPDRYRRGLYIWFQRTSPYPMLMTFDAPDSNVCCVRREKSNTPLQALTLLNDAAFVECAQALGARLREAKGDVKERLRLGMRLCVAREPTSTELARLAKLYDDLLALCKAKPEQAAKLAGKGLPKGVDAAEAAAWTALARTLLNLDEFVTRE